MRVQNNPCQTLFTLLDVLVAYRSMLEGLLLLVELEGKSFGMRLIIC